MSDLLPCPFCSSGSRVAEFPQDLGFMPHCAECGIRGHIYPTESAAIAAWNRRAGGWRPIETAPKDGTEILLYCPEWDTPYLGAWGHAEDSILDGWMSPDVLPLKWTELVESPTHWMPLPAPPESEAGHD